MITLIIFTGIFFSIKTHFLQMIKMTFVFKKTLGSIFHQKDNKNKKSISQFQALSTSLAATIGTGSIAGVASAVAIGGAGTLFWMWVCAFFGMMTVYAENVLGIYFRKKNKSGEWSGGAMYYIKYGLKSKWLAALFSIFCILASFGMGNMAQSNTISIALNESMGINIHTTGIVLAIITAIIIIGGIKRIGKLTQILIPIMFFAFVINSVIVLYINKENIPFVIEKIFREAFGLRAIGGGICGTMIKNAISIGVKRGVFSNEAGLGSSVMAHSCAEVKEPVEQGFWGIIEVFIDTIAVCTLTGFVVLVALPNISANEIDGTMLVIKTFSKDLGLYGEFFSTFSIIIFAFATLIGWSVFGEKSTEYLFKEKGIKLYKFIFCISAYVGAVLNLELVWDISDLFNGLMAIPNLISLWLLSGVVVKITTNYFKRKNGDNIYPKTSFYNEKIKL